MYIHIYVCVCVCVYMYMYAFYIYNFFFEKVNSTMKGQSNGKEQGMYKDHIKLVQKVWSLRKAPEKWSNWTRRIYSRTSKKKNSVIGGFPDLKGLFYVQYDEWIHKILEQWG